jgi:hypothetical protein
VNQFFFAIILSNNGEDDKHAHGFANFDMKHALSMFSFEAGNRRISQAIAIKSLAMNFPSMD